MRDASHGCQLSQSRVTTPFLATYVLLLARGMLYRDGVLLITWGPHGTLMARRQPPDKDAQSRGKILRTTLYVALAVSAGVTLVGLPPIQRQVEAGQLHPLWLLTPALCFGLFIIIYVADRLWLLRYRKYPSGRALFQILFACAFMLLLLPSSVREYRSVLSNRQQQDQLSTLMTHKEARVRSMACELAAHRQDASQYVAALGRALAEPQQYGTG